MSMIYDLQRASMWKRVSAWLLDAILLCITATMMAWLLSLALNYDGYQQQFDARYAYFESEYGVSRHITQADVDSFDYIYYMDSSNLNYLRRMFPGETKFQSFLNRNVADPWYTGDFTATWADLCEGCSRILEELA